MSRFIDLHILQISIYVSCEDLNFGNYVNHSANNMKKLKFLKCIKQTNRTKSLATYKD